LRSVRRPRGCEVQRKKIVFYASIPIPATPIIGNIKASYAAQQIRKYAEELGCSVKMAVSFDKIFLKIECNDPSAAMEVRAAVRECGGRIYRTRPTLMPFIF